MYPAATEIHNFTPTNTTQIIESLDAARTGELREWVVYSDSSSTGALVGAEFDYLLGWPMLMRAELEDDGVPIAGTGFCRILDNTLTDDRWAIPGIGWWKQHKTHIYTDRAGAVATFTTDRAGDRVTLRWYDGGSGTPGEFEISVAGGAPTTVSTTATPGWRHVTVNESIGVGETVDFTQTSGRMAIFAVCVWNSTGGLLIHNIGQGGSAAYASTGSGHDIWVDDADPESLGQTTADITISGDPPSLVIISLGGNDKVRSASDANLIAALTTVAGRDASDHILIAETQLNDSLVDRTTWETTLLELYDLADALDVPLIDQDERLGPYTQIVADGKNADSAGHLTAAALEDIGRSTGSLLLTLGEEMANGINDAGLTLMAAAYAAAATHAQLHSGDPGAAGTSNLASGSPARQAIAWDADADGDLSLTGAETFTGITASSAVTWISLWDALTSGTWLGNFQLSGDLTANAAGEYVLTEVTLTGTSS